MVDEKEDEKVYTRIYEIEINDIKNSIKNIESDMADLKIAIETKLSDIANKHKMNDDVSKIADDKILNLLFGHDMQAGLITQVQLIKQSVNRIWWMMGIIASAFLITGSKVWLF